MKTCEFCKGTGMVHLPLRQDVVDFLRAQLEEKSRLLDSVSEELTKLRQDHAKSEDCHVSDMRHLVERTRERDAALLQVQAFDKDCDCGDKGCCLRIRQGRPGVLVKRND